MLESDGQGYVPAGRRSGADYADWTRWEQYHFQLWWQEMLQAVPKQELYDQDTEGKEAR